MESKTLKENLEWAVKQAKKTFEQFGYHSHMIIAFSPDTVFPIQIHYKNDEQKMKILSAIKKMFIAEGVDSYIFISEAWSAEVATLEGIKSGDIKKHPNRKESLSLLAVSKTEKIATYMEIFRDGDKVWLGEPVSPKEGEFAGNFADLLEEEPKNYS